MNDEMLRGARVLLVEDEPLIALELEAVLRDAGCEVTGPLGSVERALAALAEAEALDAAVLDVSLGDEDVFPVAAALDLRAIPFVFLTGHSHEQLPAPYRRRVCLAKPFRTERLVSLLAAAMRS